MEIEEKRFEDTKAGEKQNAPVAEQPASAAKKDPSKDHDSSATCSADEENHTHEAVVRKCCGFQLFVSLVMQFLVSCLLPPTAHLFYGAFVILVIAGTSFIYLLFLKTLLVLMILRKLLT